MACYYIIYKTRNSEYITLHGAEQLKEYINTHKEYNLYDVYDRQLDILYSPK